MFKSNWQSSFLRRPPELCSGKQHEWRLQIAWDTRCSNQYFQWHGHKFATECYRPTKLCAMWEFNEIRDHKKYERLPKWYPKTVVRFSGSFPKWNHQWIQHVQKVFFKYQVLEKLGTPSVNPSFYWKTRFDIL